MNVEGKKKRKKGEKEEKKEGVEGERREPLTGGPFPAFSDLPPAVPGSCANQLQQPQGLAKRAALAVRLEADN